MLELALTAGNWNQVKKRIKALQRNSHKIPQLLQTYRTCLIFYSILLRCPDDLIECMPLTHPVAKARSGQRKRELCYQDALIVAKRDLTCLKDQGSFVIVLKERPTQKRRLEEAPKGRE